MNLITTQKVKKLTEQQSTFLNALFGKANGIPKKAGDIAGYSEHSYPKVVKALKDEIIEQKEVIKHQKYQIKQLQKDLFIMYTRLKEIGEPTGDSKRH